MMTRIDFAKWITGAALMIGSVTCVGQRAPGQWQTLGTMEPLPALNIVTSRWSIGGETLDRDYADYDAYKGYLDSLGAKRIRLQGGWAKCEKTKGAYDFTWLDHIVNDAKSRGVEPWLQLSYGNPIYPGGGEAILAGGIPVSAEALEAWDKWVQAIVRHFRDRVTEWEIWNEPDISKRFHARDFVPFYERTAAIVKKEQPGARLIAMGLADVRKIPYADSLLAHLKKTGHLDYVDAISYHGYTVRPEDNYHHFTALRNKVREYDQRIELWQGENGAPSTPKGEAVGAMTRDDWSEMTQAKWNLRRMLGDVAYKVDVTNIFQISDMYYGGTDHLVGLNSKGLLRARPDRTIEKPKLAYAAYQHAATLLRGKLALDESAAPTHQHEKLMAITVRRSDQKNPAVVVWFAEGKPAEQYAARPVTVSVKGMQLKKPVLVDLLTGKVTAIPRSAIRSGDGSTTFTGVPVTDSPSVIVDASWLTWKKTK